MTPRFIRIVLIAFVGSLLFVPRASHAQWYAGGYLGATHTQNATVTIRQPSAGLALDFHDVRFISESQQPRRYYGLRLGRLGAIHGRFGLELELIHMKAIADTSRNYPVTDAGSTSLALIAAQPMDLVVQEYRMTHGLNLALVNVVMRRPLGSDDGRVSLMVRAGGGPTFPHAETTVNGGTVHHYEYAGLVGQAAAGFDVRLGFRASALAEYKLTYCRPDLEISGGGTSTTTALAHHISLGLTIALTKN